LIDFSDFIDNAVSWALSNQHRTDYVFKCLAFVEDAYEYGNSIEMFGGSTATESAIEYGVHPEGLPPKGSFVFYSATGPIDGVTRDWGHVGLCIGDKKVIHTWNTIRIDNYMDVEALPGAPGWSQPRYLGWTSPSVFLKGYIRHT
jgi:cell wall-associated NlpC family hydrolase